MASHRVDRPILGGIVTVTTLLRLAGLAFLYGAVKNIFDAHRIWTHVGANDAIPAIVAVVFWGCVGAALLVPHRRA